MLRESVRNDRQRKRGKEKISRMRLQPYLQASGASPHLLHHFFPAIIPARLNEVIDVITRAHVTTSPSLDQIKRFRLVRTEV